MEANIDNISVTEQLLAVDRALVETGFTKEEAARLCSRGEVLNLLKLLRGYSVLTVLKPYTDHTFVRESSDETRLLTDARLVKLGNLLSQLNFANEDVLAVYDRVLFTQLLHYFREQAAITEVVPVIDLHAVDWHEDFFGCRGADHYHKKELLVLNDTSQRTLGRFRVCIHYGHRKLTLLELNEPARDYFVQHPELIPERWEDRYDVIVFEATRNYRRGFMRGHPQYSRPSLRWDKKNRVWERSSY